MSVSTALVESCLVVRLERPEVLNAINEAMVTALESALEEAHSNEQVRALILVGTGRAFCVGSDLKERGGDALARIQRMHRLILRLVAFPKTTVAAFNGLALGGGLELGLACNFRVAAPEARLGLPEITHGLMPAYGGTQLLPRIVGLGRALEMALGGSMLEAAQALTIGLVNEVNADALGAALALAGRTARGSAIARQAIRRAMVEGAALPLEQGLLLEQSLAVEVGATPEALAAVAHFGKPPSARAAD